MRRPPLARRVFDLGCHCRSDFQAGAAPAIANPQPLDPEQLKETVVYYFPPPFDTSERGKKLLEGLMESDPGWTWRARMRIFRGTLSSRYSSLKTSLSEQSAAWILPRQISSSNESGSELKVVNEPEEEAQTVVITQVRSDCPSAPAWIS